MMKKNLALMLVAACLLGGCSAQMSPPNGVTASISPTPSATASPTPSATQTPGPTLSPEELARQQEAQAYVDLDEDLLEVLDPDAWSFDAETAHTLRVFGWDPEAPVAARLLVRQNMFPRNSVYQKICFDKDHFVGLAQDGSILRLDTHFVDEVPQEVLDLRETYIDSQGQERLKPIDYDPYRVINRPEDVTELIAELERTQGVAGYKMIRNNMHNDFDWGLNWIREEENGATNPWDALSVVISRFSGQVINLYRDREAQPNTYTPQISQQQAVERAKACYRERLEPQGCDPLEEDAISVELTTRRGNTGFNVAALSDLPSGLRLVYVVNFSRESVLCVYIDAVTGDPIGTATPTMG